MKSVYIYVCTIAHVHRAVMDNECDRLMYRGVSAPAFITESVSRPSALRLIHTSSCITANLVSQ